METKSMDKSRTKEIVKCCLCGKKIPLSASNDPWPVVAEENARCCSKCNMTIVIPARIQMRS